MPKTRDEFEKWHAKNPHIWKEFDYIALEIMERKLKYSAHAIITILRWRVDISTTGSYDQAGNRYKIQNDWFPFYARKFNRRHKCNFFILRESAADQEPWDNGD